MALRPPTAAQDPTVAPGSDGAVGRDGMVALALRFPEVGAAEEVRELSGSRVDLRAGDGIEVTALIDARSGDAAIVRVPTAVRDQLSSLVDGSAPDGSAPDGSAVDSAATEPAAPAVVSWTELNDFASVDASIARDGSGDLVVYCGWPPRRVQRRALRRLVVELPLWFVRTDDQAVLHGVTRDLSGGGLSAALPESPLEVGERVVCMLRTEGRDLVLPSIVHWDRPDQSVVAVRFEKISQPDQDHLVRVVSLGEAARGR